MVRFDRTIGNATPVRASMGRTMVRSSRTMTRFTNRDGGCGPSWGWGPRRGRRTVMGWRTVTRLTNRDGGGEP